MRIAVPHIGASVRTAAIAVVFSSLLFAFIIHLATLPEDLRPHVLDVSGVWKAAASTAPDGASPAVSDDAWKTLRLPGPYAAQGLPSADGWLRKHVVLTPEQAGEDAFLVLGGFRSGRAIIYMNGHEVARTTCKAEGYKGDMEDAEGVPVPKATLQAGDNLLAIRVHYSVLGDDGINDPRMWLGSRALLEPWLARVTTLKRFFQFGAQGVLLLLLVLLLVFLGQEENPRQLRTQRAAVGVVISVILYTGISTGSWIQLESDSHLYITMVALTIYGIVASVLAFSEQHALGRSTWPGRAVMALFALFSAAVILVHCFGSQGTAVQIYNLSAGFALLVTFATGGLCVWMMVRTRAPKDVTIGIALVFASIAAASDLLNDLQLMSSPRLFTASVLNLAVAIAAVVIADFVKLAYDNKALSARLVVGNAELGTRVQQLESRQREIQHLNEELRRQIGDRSSRLVELLASVGASTVPHVFAPGELIQGRYQVVRELGAGGMGTVYEVLRTTDQRRLAVKITSGQGDSIAVARLAREAQIAAHLSHPNVVSVLDVDIDQSSLLYMVMEFVDGASLYERRSRFGDVAWGLPILQQLAEGLAALHAADIVHRDLKPGNVLLQGEDTGTLVVKITDFGISRMGVAPPAVPRKRGEQETSSAIQLPGGPALAARAASRSSAPAGPPPVPMREGGTLVVGPPADLPSGSVPIDLTPISSGAVLTQVGSIVGTPAYLAPEAFDVGSVLSPASDIFSFGVLAHEVLMGKRPFRVSPLECLSKGLPLERPSSFQDCGLNAELAEKLDACLSLKPEGRPDARALAASLKSAPRQG